MDPNHPLREMALLFDEVNILGDIAFKIIKGQYRFFGFIDAESHPSELYGLKK